jgi:SH3 domain-containing YSC84-like protein 1
MKNLIVVSLLTTSMCCFAKEETNDRFHEAATVLTESAGMGDKAIPKGLFDKAACVVVIPGLKKGGFLVAGQYGRGFASCRTKTGWSAPLAMRMEGGSFGLQAGGQSVDIVLLVMNQRGMDKLVGSKFTLGGEASIAAGPIGREADAMTDATMHAEILTYSRAQGIFGGISLKGSTLRPDTEVNEELYGKDVDSKKVLSGGVPAPAVSKTFLAKVKGYSVAAAK